MNNLGTYEEFYQQLHEYHDYHGDIFISIGLNKMNEVVLVEFNKDCSWASLHEGHRDVLQHLAGHPFQVSIFYEEEKQDE